MRIEILWFLQVHHKIKFFEYLTEKRGFKHIYIISHSIGSWITLQAANRRPDLPIRSLIQVFPCLSDFAVRRSRILQWTNPLCLAEKLSAGCEICHGSACDADACRRC